MRRGDLYLVNFESSTPGEPARTRPAVILTNGLANETLPHLVVAPVTSHISREYPFDIALPAGSCGLTESSRVQPRATELHPWPEPQPDRALSGKPDPRTDERIGRQIESSSGVELKQVTVTL